MPSFRSVCLPFYGAYFVIRHPLSFPFLLISLHLPFTISSFPRFFFVFFSAAPFSYPWQAKKEIKR